jgi:DNA modification methylase
MQLQIIHKSTEALIPYARNTRTHSDEQVAQIASSIREFGFLNPVITDGDNGIIAGHGRVMAARKLGIDQVPTIDASHLSEAQKRAFIIADNKLALNAGWDEDLLAIEIADLKAMDFDLDLLGFSESDLEQFLSDQNAETKGLTDPDQVPDAPVEPACCLGDIWLLGGGHRLMCGSSTDAASVGKLLSGQLPNTMITDPPYGINYDASWRSTAKGREKTARETSASLKNDDIADWYDAWILFPGSVAYVWHASAFTDVVMDSLRRAGFDVKQQIIWNKNVHALSRSDYHWKHEPCWYAVKPGKDRNWKGGRTQMTVWDIKSVIFEKDKTAHPTQKPVEIYTRSLEHHTNPGEYIYEPFGGSGTSIIACEKLGRRSLTMELDPKYCDVIINRWQNFTGQQAVLENDGRTFAEITAERTH